MYGAYVINSAVNDAKLKCWGNQVILMGESERSWLSLLTLILCISSRYCLCVSKWTLLHELCSFYILDNPF